MSSAMQTIYLDYNASTPHRVVAGVAGDGDRAGGGNGSDPVQPVPLDHAR